MRDRRIKRKTSWNSLRGRRRMRIDEGKKRIGVRRRRTEKRKKTGDSMTSRERQSSSRRE